MRIINYSTERLFVTEDTYTIHLFESSWMSDERLRYERLVKTLKKTFGKPMGRKLIELFGICPPRERVPDH